MNFDFTVPVENSHDVRFLQALLRELNGQPFLKAELSYGNELMLHIGEPVAYLHPKLSNERKGSWILGTRGSEWSITLSSGGPGITSESTEESGLSGEEIEEKLAPLSGKLVKFVGVQTFPGRDPFLSREESFGLVIDLSGGSRLFVVPTSEPDDGEEPLPDWELFTPYHTYLRVGPGLVWSYLPSDKLTQTVS